MPDCTSAGLPSHPLVGVQCGPINAPSLAREAEVNRVSAYIGTGRVQCV